MEDGFERLDKSIIKLSRKRGTNHEGDESDSWKVGFGSTGESVCVENKSKKIKTNTKLPTDPIKTTKFSEKLADKPEQTKYSPTFKK